MAVWVAIRLKKNFSLYIALYDNVGSTVIKEIFSIYIALDHNIESSNVIIGRPVA